MTSTSTSTSVIVVPRRQTPAALLGYLLRQWQAAHPEGTLLVVSEGDEFASLEGLPAAHPELTVELLQGAGPETLLLMRHLHVGYTELLQTVPELGRMIILTDDPEDIPSQVVDTAVYYRPARTESVRVRSRFARMELPALESWTVPEPAGWYLASYEHPDQAVHLPEDELAPPTPSSWWSWW